MTTTSAAEPPAKRSFEQRFEVILAILLGLAAIATAYASYKTNLADGDTLAAYQEGVRLSDSASQQYNDATQNRFEDQTIFLQVQNANINGDEALAKEMLDRLASPELKKAYDAWKPDEENTPLENETYVLPAAEEADKLDAQASAQFEDAKKKDKIGDRYTLVTVILATALFMYGVAAVAKARVTKFATMGIGVVTFVISIALIVTV
jgi:hypothetical protein